jgi:hypothetical protein
MKSRWMVWKGTRFLYQDFTNFERDLAGLRQEVDGADEMILREPKGTVLAIADLSGTVTSTQVVDLFKESATRTNGWVGKQAVVGITGVQKVLAQIVSRFSKQPLHLFSTVDEAKEWLVDEKEGGVRV